jgi:hypothetical protein
VYHEPKYFPFRKERLNRGRDFSVFVASVTPLRIRSIIRNILEIYRLRYLYRSELRLLRGWQRSAGPSHRTMQASLPGEYVMAYHGGFRRCQLWNATNDVYNVSVFHLHH